MCCVKVIPGPGLTQPQADFIGCLMTAAITAMPVFLQALMTCLGGGNGSGADDKFAPGDRERCK